MGSTLIQAHMVLLPQEITDKRGQSATLHLDSGYLHWRTSCCTSGTHFLSHHSLKHLQSASLPTCCLSEQHCLAPGCSQLPLPLQQDNQNLYPPQTVQLDALKVRLCIVSKTLHLQGLCLWASVLHPLGQTGSPWASALLPGIIPQDWQLHCSKPWKPKSELSDSGRASIPGCKGKATVPLCHSKWKLCQWGRGTIHWETSSEQLLANAQVIYLSFEEWNCVLMTTLTMAIYLLCFLSPRNLNCRCPGLDGNDKASPAAEDTAVLADMSLSWGHCCPGRHIFLWAREPLLQWTASLAARRTVNNSFELLPPVPECDQYIMTPMAECEPSALSGWVWTIVTRKSWI